MTIPERPLSAREILDLYFIENRARLLELAAFLDRIDRAAGTEDVRTDHRYRALMQAFTLLRDGERCRAKGVQVVFSDRSAAPVDTAEPGPATGAWRHEDH